MNEGYKEKTSELVRLKVIDSFLQFLGQVSINHYIHNLTYLTLFVSVVT